MRIIGANLEVADPIEDKIQDIPLEVKIFCSKGQRNQSTYQGQYQNDGYQSNNYQGNRGFYHTPCRNFPQGNSYGQSRGRNCGCGRGNYRGHGRGRPNYRGNTNYQYHQYYAHDDEYQMDHVVHHALYVVAIITLPNIA